MSFFTVPELANRKQRSIHRYSSNASAKSIIFSESRSYKDSDRFDVFLSHRKIDFDDLLVLKEALVEDFKLKVYIDHIDDSFLDRENVTKDTADLLRKRMKQCKCLFFATTTNSGESKWMPWELGFFDAHNGKVAILPVVQTQPSSDEYKAQEYLGLYPYVSKTGNTLWIHESATRFVTYPNWMAGSKP